MAGNREFDQDRFEALVLFIADHAKARPDFGRTKLAKVLFYSDFEIYRDDGASLTGATYIRMPFGPFPQELESAERSLEARGLVRLDYFKEEYEEKRIIPVRPVPELSDWYEPWQLLHVQMWTDRISSGSARAISDWSHRHPGWLLAGTTGTEIAYETALLPQERPTGQDAERAKEIAREQGWLSDDGWIWERSAT